MLVIRMQRTGRKGHAQFRVVVQDSRRTPTSGKIVAAIGHYNPHNKETVIDKEKASFYLEHGAQPSERVARLLVSEGLKMPKWVIVSSDKNRTIRNSDKLRKNRPASAEATEDKPTEAESAEPAPEAEATDVEKQETNAEIAAVDAEATEDESTTETPKDDAEQIAASDAETPDESPAESAS